MHIKFSCSAELQGVLPIPKPSIKFAPDYFKDIAPQMDANPLSGTVKRCVPFIDAMSEGFILPLWADMYVVTRGGEISIDFPPNFPARETLGSHSYEQIKGHPLSDKPYGKNPLKFINPWLIETEAGVSCRFTPPVNHMETRFKVIDGVVDTDTYYNNINFPFLWTGGDGEFIIPKGTPLVQVIPFERKEVSMEIGLIDNDRHQKTQGILGTKLKNGYRDEFWHKRKQTLED